MRSGNHFVILGVDYYRVANLGRRRFAPQQKDNGGFLAHHGPQNLVRHGFPPLFLVRVGLVSLHRQYCIEQQDTLLGPSHQMAVRRSLWGEMVDIVGKFLVNIQ